MRSPNPHVRRFWLKEYAEYPARLPAEAVAPIQNKVGAFLAQGRLARILTAPQSSFDVREVIDEGKILLVNLAKGRVGADAAALFGGLLVSALGHAALARSDQPEDARRDFCVYLDEFQSCTALSLVSMLAELRKYHVGMVLAHQYLAQIDERILDAVLGNAGTKIVFRVGAADAEKLLPEFAPEFEVLDLVRLPNHNFILKLMVNDAPTAPFSGKTILLRRPFPIELAAGASPSCAHLMKDL